MVLWRPTIPSRTNTKRCYFHYRGLECKSRKSRDIWNNRQVWPWGTKWSRAKTNRVLLREHIDHSKHPLQTTQETTLHMDITRWSIMKSDWLYSLQPKMDKLYTVSKSKPWSWPWLRLWASYCKIRLKFKKAWKTTKPFRYDLNQIPYDYIMEVTNRFKGLGLVDRVPEELWTKVPNILQEVQMWKLDHKEGWILNNWLFQIVLLEKTPEFPLDCTEIKPVNPKENQLWMFTGRTDAEAEAPILWPS